MLGKEKQPTVTATTSIAVLNTKSGISASKTKGIKKLKKNKLIPNNTNPTMTARKKRLLFNINLLNQRETLATTKPAQKHHIIVSTLLVSKEA